MIAYNRKSAFRFYPALLMLAATIILASAEEHYQISSSRSQLIFIYNSITLSCSSIPDGVSGVSFFLNGSLVNFGNIHSFSFAFVIDPSLEGDYTCGVGEEQGAPVRLVAYPGIPILQPQTFYGAVNTTARLDCLVTPGRLVDHYYVTWQHGSDSNIQYFRLLPLHLRTENNSIVRLNDRYSIDYTNFSLFISNVEPGETGSEFICLMGVTDPLHPDNVYLYSTALTTKITMSLYWTPEFTMTPLSHTFLESDASSATFSCSAVSAPGPPKIAWRHNGAMVTDYLVDFFAVPDMPVGGGRYPPPPTRVEIFYDPEKSMVAFETSSSLTVNGLSLADDGTAVECCVAYFNDTLLLHTECKPALLTIVVEPEISLQPSVLTVAAGLQTTATFTLSFTVDSSMANHYSYKIIFKHRGDQASLQSNKYQVENSTSLERFRSEGLLSVVFTIEDLVWPEDGGIVECVVMTYTNNGSIEFIDSLIGNTSTSARLDIIKLTVTQIDTADPNNITLKCATVDDNMAESETAIFEFSDISGQTQLLLLVGGEAKLNMSATGDVVGTCTLRGVTSAPVAIASLPHSPAHTTSHTVEARPGETASLDCPFPYTPLQNTLSVFHISWLRLSSSGGSAQGVESDPNMKRYGTGLGNRGLSTLTVPVEEGDVAMPLQFRCVLQLSRCNDSENALCGVTEVLGPLITVRGKGLSNDSDVSSVTTPPAPLTTETETTPITENVITPTIENETTPAAPPTTEDPSSDSTNDTETDSTTTNMSTTTKSEFTPDSTSTAVNNNNNNNNNKNTSTEAGYKTGLIVTTPLLTLAILMVVACVVVLKLSSRCHSRVRSAEKDNNLPIAPQACIVPHRDLNNQFDEDVKEHENVRLDRILPSLPRVEPNSFNNAAYESIPVFNSNVLHDPGVDLGLVQEDGRGMGGRGCEHLGVDPIRSQDQLGLDNGLQGISNGPHDQEISNGPHTQDIHNGSQLRDSPQGMSSGAQAQGTSSGSQAQGIGINGHPNIGNGPQGISNGPQSAGYEQIQPYEVISGYERVQYNATLQDMLLEGARTQRRTRHS